MASIYDKASLVMIPSGSKEGKLYSQKPVSGDGDFTFSRSTAATRVNADGNIEKETQNIFLQSNTFSTSWTNDNASVTSGHSGYDGTNNAWKLIESATTAEHLVRQTPSFGGVVTLSVYAKANTRDWLWLRGVTSAVNVRAWFDLTNGVVGGTLGNVIDHNIESVGGGWYRCSLTLNHDAAFEYYIGLSSADGLAGYAGDGSSSIYIQDAQLEQGLVARDYIETTTTAIYGGITDNVPRLDYTDSSCPALLLEPQRTNIIESSEYYGGSDWSRTRCGIVTNTSETLSPEGLYNASKMISTDASESYAQDNVTLGSTSGTYTFFAKKGDLDYCHALVWDIAANGRRQWFNLATGAVGTTTNFGSGYTKVDATIEDYGNGWYRCSFSWSGGNTTSAVRINISSGDGVIGSPVNSYGYFYGAQVEAGVSYATSYIPTYGSAVTRNQDNTLNSSAASIIGQTEGSIYAEVDFKAISEESRFVQISDGTNNNRFYIGALTTNNINYTAITGGTTIVNISSGAQSSGIHKVAAAYANNDFVLYIDGTQISADTSGSVSAMDEVSVGYNGIVGNRPTAYGHRKIMLFPTRLSNEELATLTTI